MAWFSSNRKASIIANSVQVSIPNFVVEGYQTFGVTAITTGPSTTSITFVNENVNTLPVYDPVQIVFSRLLKAIVVRVTFAYQGTIPITFAATTLNANFSTGTTGTNPYDDNFTSNCIQATRSTGTTLTSGWTSANLTYTNSNSVTFVTIGTPITKVTSVPILTINPGDTQCWFVLEYRQPVMDYIVSSRTLMPRDVVYQDDITYRIY